jgi:hypothetical protein
MKLKPYWHELTNEQRKAVIDSKMLIKDFLRAYRQPSWCSYPEALAGVMGCWSLMETDMKVSPEYCKKCEMGAMNMNDKVTAHRAICQQLNEIYERKNKAYGDAFGITFKSVGIISALVRMEDKWQRIKALSKGVENSPENKESIEDTLLDLANYAIMTVMELNNESTKS